MEKDTIRSLYLEMLDELEVAGCDDDYCKDLIRRSKVALEHADETGQPWPIHTPIQPSWQDWRQSMTNREAALHYLKMAGIVGADGQLVPHLRPD
jgi:hypothetical protein